MAPQTTRVTSICTSGVSSLEVHYPILYFLSGAIGGLAALKDWLVDFSKTASEDWTRPGSLETDLNHGASQSWGNKTTASTRRAAKARRFKCPKKGTSPIFSALANL